MGRGGRGKDWGEVAAGAAIIALTVGDIIPGDEIAGIPLGMGLILHGLRYIR